MDNKSFGEKGEKIAAEFLRKEGYSIIRTNYRSRYGEIDVVAKDKDVLCFIEVKLRRSLRYGSILEAISGPKRKKIINLAMRYLSGRDIDSQAIRFDVVTILMEQDDEAEIKLLKNAFEMDLL